MHKQILNRKCCYPLQKLISLLQWMKQHDLFTSSVESTLNKETLVEYLGKPVYLKKWIQGEVHEDLNIDIDLSMQYSVALNNKCKSFFLQ